MPRRNRNKKNQSKSARRAAASASSTHVDEAPESTNVVVEVAAPPDLRYECTICWDAVKLPVVTPCGHLFCWSCLYQWLEPGMTRNERLAIISHHHHGRDDGNDYDWLMRPSLSSQRICPACRGPCAVTMVVPIYARGESNDSVEQTDTLPASVGPLPPRPTPLTSERVAGFERRYPTNRRESDATEAESTEGSESWIDNENLVEALSDSNDLMEELVADLASIETRYSTNSPESEMGDEITEEWETLSDTARA